MLAARHIPLDPPRVYNVKFESTFDDDIADHPKQDELVDEAYTYLGIAEKHVPKDKIKKVYSSKGIDIWRLKPHTDLNVRILYWPDGQDRHVLMTIPRKTDYLRKDLELAAERAVGVKRAKSA